MSSPALLSLLVCLAGQTVSVPPEDEILRSLRPGHPRLMATDADQQQLRGLLAGNEQARAVLKALKAQAEGILQAKPIEHKLVGPRLLTQSRRCLDRVYTLATVYRLEGDRRYADRAIREMLVAAEFKDWNPRHFLDTAEMTHALAVGYDWLYGVLTDEQRATIRDAIVEKGLREGEKVYRAQAWWTKTRYNWNQVCNGGMTIGALAVADEHPQFARWIVHQACRSVQVAMEEFAPDGGWAEGPGYWNYATRYNVYMLAALESALGTDFGLSSMPGFSVTGDFRVHVVGPTGLTFNFADGGASAGTAAQMYWLARKFNRPLYAWHEREVIGGNTALDLWWFDPRGDGPEDEPLARHFRHTDVVLMRSAWNDPQAIFVGLKAGNNAVNHSQLELGSFVLDALGQRWALDLGSDNYNLPAYFGAKRWTYYRLATEGQNTLWVNGENQNPRAVAPLVAFESEADRHAATADLSAAYNNKLGKVLRTVRMTGSQHVEVEDRIERCDGAEIVWQMHTRAKVALAGSRAELRQDGQRLLAEVVSPTDAQFELRGANPPPPQGQQPDVQKLVVRLADRSGPVQLLVRFTPQDK